MIGMVLVTHGHLATEFKSALEHVVGPQIQIAIIAIAPDDNVEARRADMVAAVASVETGDGVVVLTDMFGGTPSNLAISIMEPGRVEVVAGINLPMLVKLASVRKDKTLVDAVTCAQDAGRKYITVPSRVLAAAS
jgi:PTS system mannose-specific IIA component